MRISTFRVCVRIKTRQLRISGFTLLELTLVVLLIAVLIGLSTPLFRRTFSSIQIRNISFNIAKTVNYAQEMAIVEKVSYKLNFNYDEGSILLDIKIICHLLLDSLKRQVHLESYPV